MYDFCLAHCSGSGQASLASLRLHWHPAAPESIERRPGCIRLPGFTCLQCFVKVVESPCFCAGAS